MVPRKNKPKNFLAGYEDFQMKLDEFDDQLKDAVSRSTEGQKRGERDWEIFQLEHQRARYIYESRKEEAIPKDVYDQLLDMTKYNGAKNLIARWKSNGYEFLCCLSCIRTNENNFGSTCICRVPKDSLKEQGTINCVTCGCPGCGSSDQ